LTGEIDSLTWSIYADGRTEMLTNKRGGSSCSVTYLTNVAEERRMLLLILLAEKPRHAHELMRRLGKGHEASAEFVYAALRQLCDEGLVVLDEAPGWRMYRLSLDGEAELRKQRRDKCNTSIANVDSTGCSGHQINASQLELTWSIEELRASALRVSANRATDSVIADILDILEDAKLEIHRLEKL
jgi:DNA-binding PadR family transcriptional regulator